MTRNEYYGPWKKARGDHMLTTAIVSSIAMTTIIAVTIFGDLTGLLSVFWFAGSVVVGALVPLYLVPNEWIDFEGKIPAHTFWKELLS